MRAIHLVTRVMNNGAHRERLRCDARHSARRFNTADNPLDVTCKRCLAVHRQVTERDGYVDPLVAAEARGAIAALESCAWMVNGVYRDAHEKLIEDARRRAGVAR